MSHGGSPQPVRDIWGTQPDFRFVERTDSFGYNHSMDSDYSASYDFHYGTQHRYHGDALLSATEEVLEGTPSEFSIGRHSYAPTDPSPDADLLCAPEDDLEGTPSESSLSHVSHASTEPSFYEGLRSDTEDGSEGTPSESSLRHYRDAPTELSSDADCRSTGSSSSPASGLRSGRVTSSSAFDRPFRPTPTYHPSPKYRRHYTCRQTTAHTSAASRPAVLTRTNHPAGTPSGSVHPSLEQDNEQEGTPSCSEPRPLASPPQKSSEAAPAHDFEQQLSRILTRLAKLKRTQAVIHVAAGDSSSQLERLNPRAGLIGIACADVEELIQEAEAAEDAWLDHLGALAGGDRAASTSARRHYDRFCEENGLYANLERAKELLDMLVNVFRAADDRSRRLKALSPHQKNESFSIVGKMPPVKLYKLPGTPGGSLLQGRRLVPALRTRAMPTVDSLLHLVNGQAHLRRARIASSAATTNTGLPTARHTTSVLVGSSPISASYAGCAFMQAINPRTAGSPTAAVSTAQLITMQLCAQSHISGFYHPVTYRRARSLDTLQWHLPLEAAAHRATAPPRPAQAHGAHDDGFTTTNPLDTKPPSSSSTQPPAAANVEDPEHQLARAIASFFQRHSAGTDVVIGSYASWTDNAGRTFYRILKPLPSSFQLPCAATDLYDHLQVDRVIMVETTAHVLPCDPLLSSCATPAADSRQSTRRFTHYSAGSPYCVRSTTQGVAATDLSGIAPRQATVVSDLATAMRTPKLPRSDALSPTTTDSALTEVEPEDQGTASRRSRRKRGPRRKQSDHARSTTSTQSSRLMATGTPSALIATAGPYGPGQQDLAGSETSGTPLVPLERVHGPDVQQVRTWTASSRKKPLQPPPTAKPRTRDVMATTALAQRSFAPGGPSAPRDPMGIDITLEKRESGTPLTLSTTTKESGTPLTFSPTVGGEAAGAGNSHPPPEDYSPIDEDPPNKDNTTTPHTTEDRTSTGPTSRATASSPRGRRGSSGRYGPATRRRW